MKKIILILTIVIASSFAFGQITERDTTKKTFNNIIEFNANGIMREIISLSNSNYYNSQYIVGYKRVFKNNAIRLNIGGGISNDNSTNNDTVKSGNTRNTINVALGFEHYSYLRKRWNMFYGIDIKTNYTKYHYLQGNTATSSYEETQINYGYGPSPLIGLQFKINSRFSITTEASFDILFTSAEDSRTNIPQSQYNSHSKDTGMQTTFNAPLAINFRIHF